MLGMSPFLGFFVDDIILVSNTAAGLKGLFIIVKSHCHALMLAINTGEGKSGVISPCYNLIRLSFYNVIIN